MFLRIFFIFYFIWYGLDSRRLLRNEKDRLAYASMDPTKKSELLAKQRDRYEEKRHRISVSSPSSNGAGVIPEGIHLLKFDTYSFTLLFKI